MSAAILVSFEILKCFGETAPSGDDEASGIGAPQQNPEDEEAPEPDSVPGGVTLDVLHLSMWSLLRPLCSPIPASPAVLPRLANQL